MAGKSASGVDHAAAKAAPAAASPSAEVAAPALDSLETLQGRLGNRALQRALTAPDDPRERLADREAERVLRSTAHDPRRRAAPRGDVPAWRPADQALRHLGPGRPLTAALRAFMEPRFGGDLAAIRVHDDAAADLSARSLRADAFAAGRHLVFRAGLYAPEGARGKRLLAHELAHSLQQAAAGDPGLRVQRQARDEPAPADAAAGAGVQFWFSVRLDRVLDGDELMLQFLLQYQGIDEAEAQALIGPEGGQWHWNGVPPTVTPADVANGYKLIRVRDNSLRAASAAERRERGSHFRGLSGPEQDALNEETDRRFWDRTHYREGEALSDTPDDERMADYWRVLRDELVRQRIQIEHLPPEIRAFIFGDSGRRMTPADYEAVLRIAERLMSMSPAERAAYLARTTSATTDLGEFEASLQRYANELYERREASFAREDAKTGLTRMEAVYDEYRTYMTMLRSGATGAGIGLAGGPMAGMALGTSLGMQPTLNRLREELTAHLQEHGYGSIGAFETAIRAFEAAFEAEAVFIGKEMLDRVEHGLWTQQQRYADSTATAGLHRDLAPARAAFAESSAARWDARAIMMTTHDLPEEAVMRHLEASRRADDAQARGLAAVSGLAAEHPLLGSDTFPAEAMATAAPADFATELQAHIAERIEAVRTTRRNLDGHPSMIWDLDLLLQQARTEQDIRPDSVFDKIIRDHLRDATLERAMITLGVTVLALGAGLVSMGTGTVAVLGGAAAFGLSAYQAWDEYRRYEVQQAAHDAELLSDDPSFAWVVVAVVGAGLDLAGLAAATRTLQALRPAAQAFEETGDLVQLEQNLRRLSEIDAGLRANLLRAAEAEAESTAAWRAARQNYYGRAMAVIDPIVTPLLNLAVHFTYPVYLSLRRGIISLERFLLTREAVSLIGEAGRLSPAQMARVRSAYRLAWDQAQAVAAHGHGLGMLDTEIERFLLLWNRHPQLTAEEMMAQMTQWAEPLARRAGARARVAPEMILEEASRARLPDLEHQIAGTGGIDRIIARDAAPGEGRLAVTIEGEILPQRLTRRADEVTPTRRMAPSFNASDQLFSAAEAGLSRHWQRLHLWGPGFGDEAAAGMMWGPREVNLVWQNQSVESYVRQLGELSRRHGGRTRVRATAISWENPTPGGWLAPQGENFLKRAEYEITLVRPGQPDQPIRVTLDVTEPPAHGILSFSIDPPGAANLGDLFPP